MAKKWINVIVILLLLYLQQFQLSYSATVGLRNNLTIALPWVLLNMLIVAIPFFGALVLLKKVKWAILVNTVLFTLLSIMNYHVLLFHGSPFLAGDIFSIPTALNVLSEYSIVFDDIVKRLCILCAIELLIWFAFYYVFCKTDEEQLSVKRCISMLLSVLSFGLLAVLFFSPYAIFEGNLITWSWSHTMNQYGYGVCFYNSVYTATHIYAEPENYHAGEIECGISDDADLENGLVLPDIILILNETLADLDVYLDQEESKEIFSRLKEVDGLVRGYTVSSLIGGGTNNSEYELLTSNSMQGLSISAPFCSIDMTQNPSITSYMNKLGYTTAGMHCGNETNYNRNRAYADMGFDHVRLGREAFTYSESGNRSWLDSDNYRDMIELYEACDDSPRFMYLLTYQNHGGYEQNDAGCDTVSVSSDYGEYTDDINEYLTSVDQSVDAFLNLIQYFEKSDRQVVIMMLGDHAPAFISDLPSDKGLTGEQQEIAKRIVPYYVWSNDEIDKSVFPTYASMVDLVPLMLKSVGMPLTGYYKTIIDLNKVVPIRTSTGHYMDANGNVGNVTPDYQYYNTIQNYYYLEYNGLIHADDYNPAWFELNVK